MLKFDRIRPGEYMAEIEKGMFLLVERKGHHRQWWWCIVGVEGNDYWETEDNGPYGTRKEAIAAAVADYEDFLD